MIEGRTLVVGGDSTIGKSIVERLQDNGVDVWKTTRHKHEGMFKTIFIDLSNDIDKWEMPSMKFDTVFICTAITSIKECENYPQETYKVNVVSTVELAAKLTAIGAFVIFLSSNAVFDGSKAYVKYNENTCPQTEYGKQKAQAELLLTRLNKAIGIVRLNKVITPQLTLLKNWIDDLKNGIVIQPFNDMFMAPISLSFATKVLLRVAEQKKIGITQVSSANDISYSEAARYIAKKMKISDNLIQPISYKKMQIDYAPLYTTFDGTTLFDLGLKQPDPYTAFDHCLNFS